MADTDVGEGTGDLQLSLSVNFGTLTLASTDGLNFTAGEDNSDAFTFIGIPDKINSALEGLVYTPNPNIKMTIPLLLASVTLAIQALVVN